MAEPSVVVSFHRGDDKTLRGTFTNPDGSSYDLTGAKIRLVCKAKATDADADAKWLKDVTETPSAAGAIILPATLGKADFYLLRADTTALGLYTDQPPVSYVLGGAVKTSAGKQITTTDGTLRLKQQVVGLIP
jgi:hypothetical protein